MEHKRHVTCCPQGCCTQSQTCLPKALEGYFVEVQVSHGLVVQLSLFLHLWSTMFVQERLSTHQGLTGLVLRVYAQSLLCLWAQGSLLTVDHTQCTDTAMDM